LVESIDYLLAMNGPSLHHYAPMVKKGGTIIVNSSLIEEEITIEGVHIYYIEATEIAQKMNLPSASSVVMLAALCFFGGVVSVESLIASLPLSLKKLEYVEKNRELLKQSIQLLIQKFSA